MDNDPNPKTVAIESDADGKVYFNVEMDSDLQNTRMSFDELKNQIWVKDSLIEFCMLMENAAIVDKSGLTLSVEIFTEGVADYILIRYEGLGERMFNEPIVRNAVMEAFVSNAKRVKSLKRLIELVESDSLKSITLTEEGKSLIGNLKQRLPDLIVLHKRLKAIVLPEFMQLLEIDDETSEG